MHPAPILLVVTPTLGDSPYLDWTVDSVRAQPLAIRHVLSVPAARVATLQERYPHTVVVPDIGKAGGIYGALNAAIAQAPAGWDWFTYINDDDLLLPGFGEMARGHFVRPDPEPVTYGDVGLIDEDDQPLGRITVAPDPRWIPALLQEGISPVMQQGMLFHRLAVARLRGFNLHYRSCADLDFWLRAYAAGHRLKYYHTPVAQFRLRRGQISGDTSVTEHEQKEIVRRLFPARLPAWQRRLMRLRYRLHNLPRYLERFRARGVRTSYQLLEQTT